MGLDSLMCTAYVTAIAYYVHQLPGVVPMFFVRWLPTVLGFPVGGWLAVQTVGSVDGPLTAALAGLIAGAVIGTAQWLALRQRRVGPRWMIHTAVGMAAGSAIAAVVTDATTTFNA